MGGKPSSSIVHEHGVVYQSRNVYIWDMDETLIILSALANGSYASAFPDWKDEKHGMGIGKRWEDIILQVCDGYFHYEQIENYNQPFLDALIRYDDGKDLTDYDFENDMFGSPIDDNNKRKLAYRNRSIVETYKKGINTILDEKMIEDWHDLYAATDAYADGWLSSAHELLQQVAARSTDGDVNVLVTSGSLIPSIVKCLLFKLDDVFSHENVYSSADVGKHPCFEHIKKRFDGPNTRFCAIGDGLEELFAAKAMKWPFIRVSFLPGSQHRFPGLDLPTIHGYMNAVYGPT